MQLRVGAAMWTHKAWPGRGLPSPLPAGTELAAYARVVDAVEGNTTFYATPSEQTVQRWASQVGEDFRFLFKLPRTITHDRRLRNASEDLDAFLRVMAPCKAVMGPLLVQLPASFGPEDVGVLEGFLEAAPSDFDWAVEVRHLGFFAGEAERHLNDMLFSLGVERVVLDSRAVFAGPCVTAAEQDVFANKPRVPARAVALGSSPIVRFIGQTDPDANPEFWQPWVDTVERWLLDGRSPYVFIHTPDNADALVLTHRFYAEVRSRLPELKALTPLAEPAEQSLFDS